MIKLILILLLVVQSESSFGWGRRGHHAVCEASTFLVKNPELQRFLKHEGHAMSLLCLIPDAQWRGLDWNLAKVGNTTHYTNPGPFLKMENMPLDYSEVLAKFPPETSVEEVAKRMGSNWWRGDQFFRLAVKAGKEKKLPEFINYLGIMGHFIGDNGSAFHAVADYDGKQINHGGIHEFFETSVVATFDAHLLSEIIQKASHIDPKSSFLNKKNLLESSKELALLTEKDGHEILKMDEVLKESSKKNPIAKRPSPEAVAPRWKNIIVEEMARSALLLAKFMDEAYEKAGKPKLDELRYHYPFQVPYVAPDYIQKSK